MPDHLTTLVPFSHGAARLLSPLYCLSALKGQNHKSVEEEEEEEEDIEEEDTSTVEPNSAGGGVTEKSNTSGDGKSSQILYVITSSPGKPERNMPGQWLGPGRTAGHSTSMCSTPFLSLSVLISNTIMCVGSLVMYDINLTHNELHLFISLSLAQ